MADRIARRENGFDARAIERGEPDALPAQVGSGPPATQWKSAFTSTRGSWARSLMVSVNGRVSAPPTSITGFAGIGGGG
ncbi:hypothetical protein ACGFIX_15920 [Nocardia salmonicida]|uniref:hypothetical protein n=1 Tax=Nocardia salmonicida TaxID=53431 RepID=UPI0037206152